MNDKISKTPSAWTGLDAAVRANLRGASLDEFFRLRDSLKAEGHQWQGDAEAILTGYIWDASEEQDASE